MADQENESTTTDAATESVSTSAPGAESVAAEPNQSTGQQRSERAQFPPLEEDGWADFGKSDEEKDAANGEIVRETAQAGKTGGDAQAGWEGMGEEDAQQEESAAAAGEKSAEDEILDEAFSKEKTDLDELDPEKMIAAQRNPAARAWAERNYKKAEVVRDFQTPDKPIGEVLQYFSNLAPERFGEMSREIVHSVVDNNPDAAFQRAYAVRMLEMDPDFDYRNAAIPSLDEIINGSFAAAAAGTDDFYAPQEGADIQINPEIARQTAELDEVFDFDWRDPDNDYQLTDEELPLVQMIRSLEAQAIQTAQAKFDTDTRYRELEDKIKRLEGSAEAEGQTKLREAQNAVGQEFRDEIEKKLMPRIAKKRQLEITGEDIPEVKSVKNLLRSFYEGTEYERANGIGTMFESFAFNESTVAKQLQQIQRRIGSELDKAADARARGQATAAKAHFENAREDEISLLTHLAKADDEFAARFITPIFSLLGKTSTDLSMKINERSERVEVATTGAQTRQPLPQINYSTAEDIWGGMVEESRQAEALRIGG